MDKVERNRLVEKLSRKQTFTALEITPTGACSHAVAKALNTAWQAQLVIFVADALSGNAYRLDTQDIQEQHVSSKALAVVLLMEAKLAEEVEEPPEPLTLEELDDVACMAEGGADELVKDGSTAFALCKRFRHNLSLYAAAPAMLAFIREFEQGKTDGPTARGTAFEIIQKVEG